MKKIIVIFIPIILSLLFSIKAECSNKVVIIDPGHGGEALGGNMDDRIERDINLITAQAFQERLSMYDGVDVYITRDNNTDADMDRKTRFKIAREKNADLFCSVHYNMSEYHTLYGTEVWTPMTGKEYACSMEFATIVNEDLASLGLFNRGIKHRESSDGGEYYGILKYGVDNSIPSVIIEHCHLDNPNDSALWNEESYKLMGYTDADAVAKYFRLSSSTLGVDYSNFERTTFDVPSAPVRADMTEPEFCNITLNSFDEEALYADITINAADSDGYIQYYSLSYDGGNTYGALIPWTDRSSNELIATIDLIPGEISNLRCMVYNQYDLVCESETIELPFIEVKSEEIEPIIEEEPVNIEMPQKSNNQLLLIFALAFILLLLIFIALLIVLKAQKRKRKKRRKRKKKCD